MFQVPESMLYLYDTGKLDVGGKQGPPTMLTAAEEEILVQHAVHNYEPHWLWAYKGTNFVCIYFRD